MSVREVSRLLRVFGFVITAVGVAPEVGAIAVMPPSEAVYTIAVSGAADTDSGGTSCTLRDALGIANAGTTSGPVNGCNITYAQASDVRRYVIDLPADAYTYTLNGSGLTISANSVSILGASSATSIIEANAAANTASYRVLTVTTSAAVELRDLTIRNGRCAGACAEAASNGGGLHVSGNTNLKLSRCALRQNAASGNGGGALLAGTTATISDTTFDGNTAAVGAGLYLQGSTATLSSSTVSNNSLTGVNSGAGLVVDASSSLTATSCTISGNAATYDGGGILNMGTTVMSSCTVTGNRANKNGTNSGGGGGIESFGPFHLQNSIVAGNLADWSWGPDCYTPFAEKIRSQGFNIVATPGGACTVNSESNPGTDLIGLGTNPLLGSLQDNGGLTFTHALQPGSPAIDMNPACTGAEATDQRGLSRPQPAGGGCDVGAFEACGVGHYRDGVTCQPCSTCAAGFYMQTACAQNANTVCTACHASCATCDGGSASDCTSCASGYLNDGVCCADCPSGSFRTAGCTLTTPTACGQCRTCTGRTWEAASCAPERNTVCMVCHESCGTCNGGTADDCLTCMTGYYRGGDLCVACGPCDDGDPCTTDTCDPVLGCTHTAMVPCQPGVDAGAPDAPAGPDAGADVPPVITVDAAVDAGATEAAPPVLVDAGTTADRRPADSATSPDAAVPPDTVPPVLTDAGVGTDVRPDAAPSPDATPPVLADARTADGAAPARDATPADAGTADAAPIATADAAPAKLDGGTDAAKAGDKGSGGCSCSLGSVTTGNSALASLLLALGAVLTLRRGRRRR